MGQRDSSATLEFSPPVRLPPPVFGSGDVVIAAPPDVPRQARTNVVARFLPVVMAIATAAMMAVVFLSRSAVARNPAFMTFPLMMLFSAVVTVMSGADRRRGELNVDRAEYLGYLSDLRAVVVETAAAQRSSLMWCHPDPDSLWTLVGGCRMWERRSSDSDFCRIRIGVGTQRLSTRLVSPPTRSTDRLDPITGTALHRFLKTHSMVPDLPIAIDLREFEAVTFQGEAAHVRALLRAMICQLAVLHPPRLVLIAAVISDRSRAHWEWLKWLPHNQHPHAKDGLGSARMMYPTLAAAIDAFAGLSPQLVVIVDDDVAGVTSLKVDTGHNRPASTSELLLRVSEDELTSGQSGDDQVSGRPDQMSYTAALTCARRLAGYRGPDALPGDGSRWQDLLGIGDLGSYTATDCWNGGSPRDRLRVPVGTTVTGTSLELDIKEAAGKGMGPHGLCIGATGSGKSEFLRTVALGMMVRHSPEALNLALIDFKGGATFAGLEPAPHVAAVITNLADKTALVARMRDALTGEMNRRQEALRSAGNLDGIVAYDRARQAGARLGPLPALFIIVDEFSELLSQHPDFADVFVAIGRLGRSLGMHLLLASQRLDEGRLRGLDSHLSYRVCLKTLSANESRMVLGTADGYELPSTPGAAYLRVGADALIRFQTAYVSGPCHAETEGGEKDCDLADDGEQPWPVRMFTARPAGPIALTGSAGGDERRTVLQTVVDRLARHGPRAHEVWLPPLGASPALETVLRDAESEGAPRRGLTIPIGIVDRPFEQRRTSLIVDLSGAAGNVAVVGAPQSGKSTALRTLVTALGLTHDPSLVQFYCLDFGGGTLTSLSDWPHVGSVAGRADPQLVRRMVTQFEAIIRTRETVFRDHGIQSMEKYRLLKASQDPRCDRFGDVFLVVDGWATVRREFETLETSISSIAAEGLSFGVHVVLSASRWAEIRPALRDQIGTRIELRLGDPADSELDRRRAHLVPEGQPGRGLSEDGLHMAIALCGGRLGERLRRPHSGCTAPPIPLLPRHVDYHSVVARAVDGSSTDVLLGLEENELRSVAIDFTQQPHLLILGDSQCGKTAALRIVCHELLRTTTGAQSQLFIIDFRRSLLGVAGPDSEHLGGYLASANAVETVLPALASRLRERVPPPDATPVQLRTRSWWQGPEIYLVIDDYDLVTTANGNLLSALLEFLPQAKDLGLHVVVARRSGGAARAMFEPLLAGLRDAGCMALLMSGSPDEGLMIGSVRPSPMPPGRGTLITRGNSPQVVQVAWSPLP
ncbi:type VII secretion protein EccCa [Mycobacterium sp.]|uniref:type VII secretion protein EccCa n=1 Tax=Mycobacterium sp. TaxID=1785 RepID=UPI003C777C59